VTEGNFGQLFI